MTHRLKSAAVVNFTQRKFPGIAAVLPITIHGHPSAAITTQSSQKLSTVHDIRLSLKRINCSQ